MKNVIATAILSAMFGLCSGAAIASPMVSGFDGYTLARNDDGSTNSAISFGFTFNFFGSSYGDAYVNNNGNITFGAPQSSFTPYALTGVTSLPIIAPFFTDIDTRAYGNPVTYGAGIFNGRNAFGVNWSGVSCFQCNGGELDYFQLLIVDRSDVAQGDADIYFNYGPMAWSTSGNGKIARAGYSNGSGDSGTFFELAGSGINGALMDGGPNALSAGSNVGMEGRYVFEARAGAVQNPPTDVPEPASLALLSSGLLGLGLMRRKARSANAA